MLRDPIEREYSVFRGRREDPFHVQLEMRRRDNTEPGSGNLQVKADNPPNPADRPEITTEPTKTTKTQPKPI